MLRILIAAIPALLAPLSSAEAQSRPIGQETTIAFASGGIKDWEAGPRGSDTVYLQDRTLHWYLVTLSGPCLENAGSDTLIYKTDNLGRLDRFSMIAAARTPQMRCRVESIKTSLAPPSRKSHAEH